MVNEFEKTKHILEIYSKYLLKLKELRLRLSNIRAEIRKEIDKKRIEEIRKEISNKLK